MLILRRLSLALTLLLAACGGSDGGSSGAPPPVTTTPAPPITTTPAYPAGLSDAMISVGGTTRGFVVYRPASVTTPRALIIVLHGGGGSGAQASNLAISPQAVFRTVADREGAVVVFPTALEANWNDCRNDAPGIGNASQDVAFLDAMLTRLEREFGVDASKIFFSGTSNGALMSMRYAFERPERIAAIAISSGNLPAVPEPGVCTTGPTRPTPILLTHGELDPAMPYAGGCVAASIVPGCVQGTVIGSEATRDRWLNINGLLGTTALTARFDVASGDGGATVQNRWPGATPVEWWRFEGAGHSPPSTSVFLARDNAGLQNRDVEFAEIAWTFFAARLP